MFSTTFLQVSEFSLYHFQMKLIEIFIWKESIRAFWEFTIMEIKRNRFVPFQIILFNYSGNATPRSNPAQRSPVVIAWKFRTLLFRDLTAHSAMVFFQQHVLSCIFFYLII